MIEQRPAHRPADFLAANRGGGLATLYAAQRGGAVFAYAAWKAGLKPTHLTLVNLVVGLAVSAGVIAYLPAARDGAPWWPVALAALVLWQVAYMLDCADGQLARVTRTGSEAGARVDILADIAIQASVVAVVVAVVRAYTPEIPAWCGAAFAALWMTNLVTAVMAKEDDGVSLVKSGNIIVRLIKLVRDYGFVIAVIALALLRPESMAAVMLFFGAVNALFLLASIASNARASLR
ncbi:CDP-alcohol phosphatidyltransferase family protein [Glycomyces sp. TRM65418]|uniref:CDP-alcohol phosphatidyltransferase family protein n=1 Tax=Glycomyces sp. TRM65418 TaxID=2867006 RepID=UPI001D16033B|nr:CDP-alcohol phosphatidyltransferase family protein [Glycomyces sp. TRM65418]MCC3765960.1 CDP-alcohol phosphatidyltransferase family protein [Glycomyces sp. TRM65418]